MVARIFAQLCQISPANYKAKVNRDVIFEQVFSMYMRKNISDVHTWLKTELWGWGDCSEGKHAY